MTLTSVEYAWRYHETLSAIRAVTSASRVCRGGQIRCQDHRRGVYGLCHRSVGLHPELNGLGLSFEQGNPAQRATRVHARVIARLGLTPQP